MRFHAFSTKRNWSLQTIKQQSNILYWSGFLSLDRPAVKAVVGNEDEGKKQKFCVEFAQCYYSSKFCRIAQSFIQLSFAFRLESSQHSMIKLRCILFKLRL